MIRSVQRSLRIWTRATGGFTHLVFFHDSKVRKEKNFAEADKIREKLALDGIILEDSPLGTKWRISN